jgi:dihydrofolate synthase / folylpolyglutamate synthase
MTFQETLDFLYAQLPVFERIGTSAYKKDLSRTLQLLEQVGNPHLQLKFVHVAGTNGKGSCSHFLASILQEAGYKTGLYTSPHIKDFGERIRINGEYISEEFVVQFVEEMKPVLSLIQPSFFELTVAMAFSYFAQKGVEIAVVETGLGGRLDSTNVITPEVSLITNISWDHADLLGNTLTQIASEKAGIIKPGVPVVIGERQSEVAWVFEQTASEKNAAISFAPDHVKLEKVNTSGNKMLCFLTDEGGKKYSVESGLVAKYQTKNIASVWQTTQILIQKGYHISIPHIKKGFSNIQANAILKGRWQVIGPAPLLVCDIAHNESGIKAMLDNIPHGFSGQLHIVMGMAKDKDTHTVLNLMPPDAIYYFSQAQTPRALLAADLCQRATNIGLKGVVVERVNNAIEFAKQNAKQDDIVLVCGSSFLVAEVEGI